MQVDYAKVSFQPATLQEYPIMQNMGRFYVYDMSEFMGEQPGWEMPEDGLYECIDFKKYWETNEAFPFLIRYGSELAGFVIVDKKGSDASIEFNMAQFFILRKFKHKGIAKYVAQQCFAKFQGVWEVMVMPHNVGAYAFWEKTISSFTSNHYHEYQRNVAHLNNSPKNIFKFSSVGLTNGDS